MDNYTNNIQNEKQDKKDEKPLPGEKLGLGTMIAGVLLMMLASGDLKMADFIYKMRGPYKALVPLKP